MANRASVHHVINSARKRLDMSEHDLWVADLVRGALGSQQAIFAFLRGTTILSEQDFNHVAIG